jgi:flagellin-like hook-associated protein FlgL
MSFSIGRIGDLSRQFALLGQLDHINREQAKIDRQMATGLRDEPVSYRIIANWLRLDKSGSVVAQDNVADGLEVLGATKTQIETVTGLLGQARDLTLRGMYGKLSAEEREQVQTEVQDLLRAADETLRRAEFNDIPLFAGRCLHLVIGPDGKGNDLYSLRLPKVNLKDFGLFDGESCGNAPNCGTSPSCQCSQPAASAGCSFNWSESPAVQWVQNHSADCRNMAQQQGTSSGLACGTTSQQAVCASTSSAAGQCQEVSISLPQLLCRIDNAIKYLSRDLLALNRHRLFLEARQKVLADQVTRYEALRSRFEDADYADLQLKTTQNDIYRQAIVNALGHLQANQFGLVAAFLGSGK